MGWFIAQSLVFILVAFAIGLLVGWLIWGRRSDRSKTVVEESSAVARPEANADETVVGAAVPAPRDGSESDAAPVSEAEGAVETSEADGEVAAIPVPRDSGSAAVSENSVESVETEPVVEADTDVDAEADAEPELETEPVVDAESEVETEPVIDPEPEVETEATADAEPEIATEPDAEAVAGAAVVAEAESVAREAAEPEPQDLKRIEGIGPKIDAALKAQGYATYASVAAATEDELRAAIKAEGVRFAPSASSWARQAQFLADGDEDGLKEYQDYLVGGQDRSVKFNEKVDFTDVDEITDAEEKAEAIAEDAAEVAAVEAAQGDATEAKA